MVRKINEIDWSNPKDKISNNFTVHEATFLPSWLIYHHPSELEKKNILELAEKLELIREYLDNRSISVHVWIRPKAVNNPKSHYHMKNYNASINGAPGSAHIEGKACDFRVSGLDCDDVRASLFPKLEEFKIRMEDLAGSSWIHVDTRQPAPRKSRYFRP